jgi:hypothetical protein
MNGLTFEGSILVRDTPDALFALTQDYPRRLEWGSVPPLQRHRGPDRSGIYATDRAVLAHERLAIVDVLHGAIRGFHAEDAEAEERTQRTSDPLCALSFCLYVSA